MSFRKKEKEEEKTTRGNRGTTRTY